MEHAQRGRIASAMDSILWSLNPYFNGTCSKRLREKLLRIIRRLVLILILMEHAQRAQRKYSCTNCLSKVLILILMEHAQRVKSYKMERLEVTSLNPYFNGTCSKRAFFIRPSVLICYIETFTLINAFASEKCTCFLLKTLQT